MKLRAVLIAALMAGCSGDSDPQSPDNLGALLNGAAPTTVVQSYLSGITEPTNRLITSADEWSRVWNQIHSGMSPRPSLPSIDFSRHALVLAAMGNTAAALFEIEEVQVFERGLVARTVLETYSDRCLVLLAIGQPVHVVRIARPSASALMVERTVRVRSCD